MRPDESWAAFSWSGASVTSSSQDEAQTSRLLPGHRLAQFPHDAQLPVHLLAVEDALVIEVLEKDSRARDLSARNERCASQNQTFLDLEKNGQMLKTHAVDEFEDFVRGDIPAVSLAGGDGFLGDPSSGSQLLP
jgi:hypothetical protein